MNELAREGRNKTIKVFASVLLISIYVIVTYHLVREFVETKKLIQQIFRFGFTVLLMYFVFKGKNWAKNIFSVLFSIAILGSLVTLFTSIPFVSKIPFITMILIYSLAVYHLNFSESFKEYFNYLKEKE